MRTCSTLATHAGQPSPKGLAWVLEPKIDGLAVNATYQDGRLVQVWYPFWLVRAYLSPGMLKVLLALMLPCLSEFLSKPLKG
eukprot:scaffold105003_cov22-Tisochrysis_lutea.AAC.3